MLDCSRDMLGSSSGELLWLRRYKDERQKKDTTVVANLNKGSPAD